MQQAALRRGFDVQVVAERREHVVHEAAAVVHVARVLRGDPGDAVRAGEGYEVSRECRFCSTSVVELHLYSKSPFVTEKLPPAIERVAGVGVATRADERRDLAIGRTCERVQSARVLGELRPRHARAAAMSG